MGEIPSGPLFSVKRWFAVAVLASTAVGVSAGQVTSAQTANNSEQASERRPIGLQQIPVEQKADILMARGEYAAAIVAYRQSNLKSAIVWNNIGMAYHHLFALEEARKAYEQALTINPRFAPPPITLLPCITANMITETPNTGTSDRSNIRQKVRSLTAIWVPPTLRRANSRKA